MPVGLVIVAAGSGARLGAVVPKAFVPLAGVPILGHAVRGASACPDLAEIVVVVPSGWLGEAESVCRSLRCAAPVTLVTGGAERGESVAVGVAALSEAVDLVLVHDAARCLTPGDVFERVVAALVAGAVAVVPGLPVVDTIKEVDDAGHVIGTPERARLRAIQTPQGFRRDVIERAHAGAVTSSVDTTDDAGLVERLGEPVLVVEGALLAAKVTTPADLMWADAHLRAPG